MAKEKVKRLYRSGRDRLLGGVCSGIADYLHVDPVIVRILWIVFTLLSIGLGIIIYLLAWVIIPRNPTRQWD